MCVIVTKVDQDHQKLLLVQRLYRTYQAAKYKVYLTSRRCSGNRNVAEFRSVPEIRGDFARLCLESGKSYEKSVSGWKHPWPFDYKVQCLDSP